MGQSQPQFRYTAKIVTNGHLMEKVFEAGLASITRVNEEMHEWLKTQMFAPDGSFYFQRDLTLTLDYKENVLQTNTTYLSVLDITAGSKKDLEDHLLTWENEAELYPIALRRRLHFAGNNYDILENNYIFFSVIGELQPIVS